MSSNIEFEQYKEQVKEYLTQYLQMRGINTTKSFKCINPGHADKHPSCSINKHNTKFGHCWSCNTTFDIFDAAAFLEGKPMEGIGFVHDNVFYLGTLFGLTPPDQDVDDEQIKIINVYRAYLHAASIVRGSNKSDKIANKIFQYGWSDDLINKMHIGTVLSYEDYIEKMTVQYKHELSVLKTIDLANKAIFSPDNLIFTFKDVNGNPVGFAARDLLWETKKEEGLKTPKYFNTSADCPIFKKSELLYNIDQAKKFPGPLFVVEGQADTVTCVAAGLNKTVGIGSTAFTKQHLQLIIDQQIDHIVYVLDSDLAGQKGMAKFMAMIESLGNNVGLKVELIELADGHDPDSFIRGFGNLKKGGAALRKLPRKDMFTWQLSKMIDEGVEPTEICKSVLPLICNEPSNLVRYNLADKLATTLDIDKIFIRKELLRLLDENNLKIIEEKILIANDVSTAIRKDPASIDELLASAQTKLEIYKLCI
jgi:DNA primase